MENNTPTISETFLEFRTINIMTKELAIEKLMKLYEYQISDLVLMSKIELGDDVIFEIKKLKEIINDNMTKDDTDYVKSLDDLMEENYTEQEENYTEQLAFFNTETKPITLSEKDAKVFFNEIENPSGPNENLVNAARKRDGMNNLDKAYQNLLRDILENGTPKEDRTGTGTISVFGRQIRHKMKEGFPLLTTKKMAWQSVVVELLWFLQGRTDLRFLLENGCHIWTGDAYRVWDKDYDAEHPPFSGPFPPRLTQKEFEEKILTDEEFNKMYGDLGPIYGKQWRSWKTEDEYLDGVSYFKYPPIDQIQNLINELKTNPDSRRLIVSAWNVSELSQMTLPPCHYGFQVYTRVLSKNERYRIWFSKNYETGMEYDSTQEPNYDDSWYVPTPERAISLMWNQRSVDTFLGLPFNIASYGLLLTLLAQITQMWPDELIGNLGDVHLYSDHIEQAKEQISREPFPLPFVNINTEFWLTESGSCGEGLLSATGFIKGLSNPDFIRCLIEEDIQLGNYKCHPSIKAPLSN
jgi:thymidylate synthase